MKTSLKCMQAASIMCIQMRFANFPQRPLMLAGQHITREFITVIIACARCRGAYMRCVFYIGSLCDMLLLAHYLGRYKSTASKALFNVCEPFLICTCTCKYVCVRERDILRDIYLSAHTASKQANKLRHCVKFIANREAPEHVLILKY